MPPGRTGGKGKNQLRVSGISRYCQRQHLSRSGIDLARDLEERLGQEVTYPIADPGGASLEGLEHDGELFHLCRGCDGKSDRRLARLEIHRGNSSVSSWNSYAYGSLGCGCPYDERHRTPGRNTTVGEDLDVRAGELQILSRAFPGSPPKLTLLTTIDDRPGRWLTGRRYEGKGHCVQ